MTEPLRDLEELLTTRIAFFGVPRFLRDLFSIDPEIGALDADGAVGELRSYLEDLCWILLVRSAIIGLLVMVAMTFFVKEFLHLPREADWVLSAGFGGMMGDVVLGLYLACVRLIAWPIGVKRSVGAYGLAPIVWPLGCLSSIEIVHLLGV